MNTKWKDKKVLVVGVEKSGQAVIELLAKNGAKLFATDLSTDFSLWKKIALLQEKVSFRAELGFHSKEYIDDMDLVVVSPGVPLNAFPVKRAQEKKIPVISELECASLFNEKPIISITGSNGKSTTSALIYQMLKEAGKEVVLGGNFGTPFSRLVLENPNADLYVLEVSSFQLEKIDSFSADVAVLTNLTPNHLDRYSSYQEYCLEKGKLFTGQSKQGWAILNKKDHAFLSELGVVFSENIVLTDVEQATSTSSVFIDGKSLFVKGENSQEKVCDLTEIMIKGRHNLLNSIASISAVLPFGVSVDSIRKVLTQFKGLSHRIEKVLSLNGVDYINDSKATSTDAVKQALNSFNSIFWIAGGRNKGSDFSSLVPDVQGKVRGAFFIGESKETLAETFDSVIDVNLAASLEEATVQAKEKAQPGDVVLFSPGCSSFDMFQNFEQRGDQFKEIVFNL